MGLNKFAYISDEEFMNKFLGSQNCSATAYHPTFSKNHKAYKT